MKREEDLMEQNVLKAKIITKMIIYGTRRAQLWVIGPRESMIRPRGQDRVTSGSMRERPSGQMRRSDPREGQEAVTKWVGGYFKMKWFYTLFIHIIYFNRNVLKPNLFTESFSTRSSCNVFLLKIVGITRVAIDYYIILCYNLTNT